MMATTAVTNATARTKPPQLDDEEPAPVPHDVNFTHTYDTGKTVSVMFPSRVTRFYSLRRGDRAGSAVQDYLTAHAFAFHFRRRYGGACGPNEHPLEHEGQVALIRLLGLQHEIPFVDKCPFNDSTALVMEDPFFYFGWKDTDVWTPEWFSYVQKRRRQTTERPNNVSLNSGGSGGSTSTMVVHVRRGDVHPCDYSFDRYLPNSHYLSLIEAYRTRDQRIILHSEKLSWEPWSDFDGIPGLERKLDADPLETVRDILNADVYIMSKSGFSIVAALFSRASTILYTQWWYRSRPAWTLVDSSLTKRSKDKVSQLRSQCTNTSTSIYCPHPPRCLK
jgi:hypothetical protein